MGKVGERRRTRKKMRFSEMRTKLPPEMEMNILSRLQVKSLLRFRCVSKEWLRLLTVDTHFIYNMHLPALLTANLTNPNPSLISLRLYTVDTTHGCCYTAEMGDQGDVKPIFLDYPGNKKRSHYYIFVGICNGLVCLRQFTSTKTSDNLSPSPKLLVWNPLTRDHITLSYFGTPSGFRPSSTFFRFGFHQATNEYKVVIILFSNEPEVSPHISVLTLGTNTWRTLDIFFYAFVSQSFPITINGSPHWLIHKSGTKHYLIVAFDVKDEVFQEIPLPVHVENKLLCPKFKEFGGLLCVINTTLQKEIEIWVMKEHGVLSSWTKQFIIRETQIFNIDCWEPVGIACNGDVTFRRGYHNHERELLLYNPETKSFKGPTNCQFDLHCVFTFAGSLVSPKVINGGARQITLTEESQSQSQC